MAKPKIFVSSTYFDLKHIRKALELFIDSLGYDSILFESGDIPFTHESPLDESCYREIGASHMLVLIIGGRFGSPTSDTQDTPPAAETERQYNHYNSITQRELETALARDIPVYIFLDKNVAAEYGTFKQNRENKTVKYAHVDSVNIFCLLDFIYSRRRNNLIREFENIDDITRWLRDQWAGLFGEFLTRRDRERPLDSLQLQLDKLQNISETLKGYSETIIRDVSPDKAEKVIHDSDKLLREQIIHGSFMQNRIIRHLLQHHPLNIDDLTLALTSANTPSDFTQNVQAKLGDFNCGYIENIDEHQVVELNALRSALGCPPFAVANAAESFFISGKKRRKL